MSEPGARPAAIGAGADLSTRARELVRMHDAVLGGSRPAVRPRPLVSRSWERVQRLGLQPDGGNVRDPLPVADVEFRRRQSPLRVVIDDLERVISSVADASQFLMVVTDADGVVLWRKGSPAVRHRADTLGFAEGATWTEALVGTNAIGTALAEAAPVLLFAGEHFEQAQHPWYCSAYPMHDPRTGDLLGVVDISGPALTLHPAVSALVETAVRLGESLLWRHHESTLDRIRQATESLVATVAGPALVVDDDGWVAHSRGVTTPRGRIGAPSTGRALAVPGLGLCLPERLDHGWLVRPPSTPQTLHARLVLGREPAVDLTSESGSWRVALSRRHAEILAALRCAGQAGLTAQQLSVALYGDADHVVTVRAEISRLRRLVGGLVASAPYRIADGVRLDAGPARTT